jgi:hypothetical protein
MPRIKMLLKKYPFLETVNLFMVSIIFVETPETLEITLTHVIINLITNN